MIPRGLPLAVRDAAAGVPSAGGVLMKPVPLRHGRIALISLAALFAPGLLGALELGAARLNSVAGAPLSVDIPLLDVQPGALETLRPSLPANSRSAALSSASIERAEGPGGEPLLRVRSAQPVPAGELRFVVVADWGRGRRFREYLLSLDGPAAQPAADQSVGREQSATPGAVSAAVPPPTETTLTTTSGAGAGLLIEGAAQSSTESSPAPGPAPTAAARRTVRSGETLMSISRELAAATGATLAQSMVGIYRANPQAFGRGGMSELLVNAELTLPDAAALGVTSPRAASSEISRTLGIWRTGGDASPPAGPAGGESTTLSTSPAPQAPAPQRAAVPLPAATSRQGVAPAAAASPTARATTAPAAPAPLALAPAAASGATPALDGAGGDAALATDDRVASLEGQLADRTADLEAARLEVDALKARLAASESALVAARAVAQPAGWLGVARHWAAAAWWSIPALALLSLLLLTLLVLVVRAKGRRPASAKAAEAPAATEPRREMSVDLPPIKPKRDAPAPDDALLQEMRPAAAAAARAQPPAVAATVSAAPVGSPASVAAPPPARTLAPLLAVADDLEGDPPPVDEAGSKINLARAFMEMGDYDAAILELQAVLRVGDERQRAEAIRLLDSMPKS